ncbi:hypothetical protein Desor_2193 [Desulfosporosinus orientis DSM 765]|uniref:SH3 domain-containing protein n=1 Tax=Desulfosporosinus orientis (strain ATCC 19365 / DSM 765 / NCIMB 8382 / VKM B-1628 / Singapore I) TaxID=768706 RepID=G7W8T5_DESOD|nr:hypothetical protein [Desulfosporosinus orientis]AET67795.1 hypothetical protein Desor_2193 [Desulfosporosinus orientis DSM 765]
MRKSLLVLLICLSIVASVTGCSDQTDLNNKIQSLEDKNKDFQMELDKINSLSILFEDYKDKQRLVPKESQIYALPIQGLTKLHIIEPNTVIQVLDAAQCQDKQLWLYVSIPVYDTPINSKGWIPESETIKLTKANIGQVQGDISLKKGTPIYEVDEFNKISDASSTKITNDVRGRILKREGSFVYLMSPGGWDFWVEEKYLIYPKID